MVTATAAKKTKTKLTPDVEKLCKEFREAQLRARKSHDEYLLAHLEMGESLAALKKGVDHGEWLPLLEELVIGERYAQQLMSLVGSALAKQIRAKDSDLIASLPLDLRVLEYLAKLPTRKLQIALRRWDFGELSRRGIEAKVNEALGRQPKKSDPPSVAPAASRVATNGQEHVDGKLDCDEPDEVQAERDPDDDYEDLGPDADSEDSDEDADEDSLQAEDDDRDSESTQDLDDDGNPVDELDPIPHAIDVLGKLTEGFSVEVTGKLGSATEQQRQELRATATTAMACLQSITTALDGSAAAASAPPRRPR